MVNYLGLERRGFGPIAKIVDLGFQVVGHCYVDYPDHPIGHGDYHGNLLGHVQSLFSEEVNKCKDESEGEIVGSDGQQYEALFHVPDFVDFFVVKPAAEALARDLRVYCS
jgi:hypothetical protein